MKRRIAQVEAELDDEKATVVTVISPDMKHYQRIVNALAHENETLRAAAAAFEQKAPPLEQ